MTAANEFGIFVYQAEVQVNRKEKKYNFQVKIIIKIKLK